MASDHANTHSRQALAWLEARAVLADVFLRPRFHGANHCGDLLFFFQRTMNKPNEAKDVKKEQPEPDKLPEGNTPPPNPPKKTLRDVMADCVSALSLGPEDLASSVAYYERNKTNPEPPDGPGCGRGVPE
jgi:hypothetical protein